MNNPGSWPITDVVATSYSERKQAYLEAGWCAVEYNKVTTHEADLIPSDVNKGIGGTTTSIFVKYEDLPPTSRKNVLAGIEVKHWANWHWKCDEGWERAGGKSAQQFGGLTTGTDGGCWRNGLCVKYEPYNEATSYISNLTLTYSSHSSTKPGTHNQMPPQRAGVDIHHGCGDGHYVYLWYYRYIF